MERGASERKRLEPELERAKRTLSRALDEACRTDVDRADTGEMIRMEETLAIANEAAKTAVSIRRKLRGERELEPPDGHRVFVDPRGREWHAFAVFPTAEVSARAQLPEPYCKGWLAFEGAEEKRRLSPVPDGWQSLSAGDLAALCDRADVVPRRAGPRDSGAEDR